MTDFTDFIEALEKADDAAFGEDTGFEIACLQAATRVAMELLGIQQVDGHYKVSDGYCNMAGDFVLALQRPGGHDRGGPVSADPTAEHIDAVSWAVCGVRGSPYMDRNAAERILTSTDPAVHAALAASLPADVMLDALVRAGVLTVDLMTLSDGYAGRLVTEWGAADLGGNAPEVAP